MGDASELRATSDMMLRMLDRLRVLEEHKRERVPGDEAFTRLAWEVTELARTVLRWSEIQLQQANEAEVQPGTGRPPTAATPLVEIPPRRLDVVLAEWRQAEIRLSQALPGSEEAAAAYADATRLRLEYGRLQQRKLEEQGRA